MKFQLTRKTAAAVLAAALFAICGIAVCLAAYRHTRNGVDTLLHPALKPGDASPAVQAEVRAALREFQNGYIQRDPRNLNAFMNSLFDKNDDILILGTDRAEWVQGYPQAAAFIKADWEGWGDLRFSVDDAVICTSGDVAWVASAGTVQFKNSSSPVRFSAVLTRHGHKWQFRQVQFQWEGRRSALARLLTWRN